MDTIHWITVVIDKETTVVTVDTVVTEVAVNLTVSGVMTGMAGRIGTILVIKT